MTQSTNALLEGLVSVLFFMWPLGVAALGMLATLALKGWHSSDQEALIKHLQRLNRDAERTHEDLCARFGQAVNQRDALRSAVMIRVYDKLDNDYTIKSLFDITRPLDQEAILYRGETVETIRFEFRLATAQEVADRLRLYGDMFDQQEEITSGLRAENKRLQEQITECESSLRLEDVTQDYDYWEHRVRDAIATALADGDFTERVLDDLYADCLEHLTHD